MSITSQEDGARAACAGALDLLQCPTCAKPFIDEMVALNLECVGCHALARRYGERIVDVLGGACAEADAIFRWPADIWDELEPHLDDLRDGRTIRSDGAAKLRRAGLINAAGVVVPLGRTIAYHQLEKVWQRRGDPLRDLVETQTRLNQESRVLDVGCGAGTTLALFEHFQPAQRVGLDRDLVALAIAEKLNAGTRNDRMMFVRGNGLALPFRDAAFTHVLSRVSLNYLPQPRALHEMTRVLAVGGYLALRIETLGFDLHGIRKAPGLRGKLGRSRDLLAGLLFNALGIEMQFGRLGGQRQFASVYRLRRLLSVLGCEIVHVAKVERSPSFCGLPSQKVVLARKMKTSL